MPCTMHSASRNIKKPRPNRRPTTSRPTPSRPAYTTQTTYPQPTPGYQNPHAVKPTQPSPYQNLPPQNTSVQGVNPNNQVVPASLWARFGCLLVQGLIRGLLVSLIGYIIYLTTGNAPVTLVDNPSTGFKKLEFTKTFGAVSFAVAFIVEVCSLGKYLCGLEVRDESGQEASWLQLLVRALVKAPPTSIPYGFYLFIFAFIGSCIMPFFTSQKQGLPDMIAGTVVVNEDENQGTYAPQNPNGGYQAPRY